jgi:hypothetical protein
MPMGFLNSHSIFVAMMSVMQTAWNQEAKKLNIHEAGSKVIIDNILLFARTVALLVMYWRCVLSVLQFYRAMANLRKCRFLDPNGIEFVRVDTRQHPSKVQTRCLCRHQMSTKLVQPAHVDRSIQFLPGIAGTIRIADPIISTLAGQTTEAWVTGPKQRMDVVHRRMDKAVYRV